MEMKIFVKTMVVETTAWRRWKFAYRSRSKEKADNKARDRIRSTVPRENSIPVNPRIVKVSINISRAQLHATGRDTMVASKGSLFVAIHRGG